MDIQENISLLPYNTFKLDCKARYFTAIHCLEDLVAIRESEIFKKHKRLVLGGGSNLLFTGDFDGLIIKNELTGIQVIDDTDNEVWVNARGGENWHKLVTHCVEKGWGGIENLALIPGCTGAAPIQNIGAYGVELKDVFVSLEAFMWDTGEVRVFFHEDCQFGYRDSVFKRELKGKVFIRSITLKLSGTPEVNTSYGAIKDVLAEQGLSTPGIQDVYQAVINIRKSKLPDPDEIGNAGSFFKNPELPSEDAQVILDAHPGAPHYIISDDLIKIPAGWMIEKCGWKGYAVNGVGVHDKQALVLVNYGSGDGNSIRELAEKIQKSVFEKFGVTLTPEVNIID